MAVYNIGFILEQALGHVTHTKNLQANVPNDPEIRAYWGLISIRDDRDRQPDPSL